MYMKRILKKTLVKALLLGFILIVGVGAVQAKNKKYGLFVGINEYAFPIPPLGGCVNDVTMMRRTLTSRFGFQTIDTTLLTNEQATREAILTQLQTYQTKAEAGDLFVFDYSGHGSLFPDQFSEELDETRDIYYEETMRDGTVATVYPKGKYDSTLVPIDAVQKTSGKAWDNMILDDELYAIFQGFTAKGVRVVFISDSCFSGSIARGGKPKFPERFVPLNKILGAESFDALKLTKPPAQKQTTAPPALNNLYLTLTAANVNETALDGGGKGAPMGLFTYYLYKALNVPRATSLTYTSLMGTVGSVVSKTAKVDMLHNQNPQLDARFGDPKTMIFSASNAPLPPKIVKKKR